MRRIYTLLIYVAVPFAFAVVLWRGLRDRGYWEALPGRFGFGSRIADGPGSIWLHAVSLGEVSAAAPILRELHRRHPERQLVLSTATPTGRARARALFGGGVDVRYLPYDMPGAARRFLERIRPDEAIVMETELWPNLLRECARRELPVVFASARLSAKSVARYKRFGRLFRDIFTPQVMVAAQTAEDAASFCEIGADPGRTHVIGNVKFDIDLEPTIIERGRALRAALLGTRSVWVAGSTHPGEEEQVLDAHDELCRRQGAAGAGAAGHGAPLLVLVPRHPSRFDGVAALLARRRFKFARRSAGETVGGDCQVLLLDTIGELVTFYAGADLAFVGGSLVPIGGHNLLEPAALGVPVLTGPSDFNGREIASLLIGLGAALRVADAHELAAGLGQLFEDPDRRRRIGAIARGAVEANKGSVARLLELVEAPRAS